MRQQSARTEVPPVYSMDTVELCSFLIVVMVWAVMLLMSLLFVPGFDNVVFFVAEVCGVVYYWPKVPAKVRTWRELRKFRRELSKHGKD